MYCELTDIYRQAQKDNILRRLRDTPSEEETVTEAKLTEIIEIATEECNGYLRGKYTTPLSPVPGFIKKLCIDIVIYNVFSRKGFRKDSEDAIISDRYEHAIKSLSKIASGELSLGIASSETESIPSGFPKVSAPRRRFDDKFWRGY